MCFVGFLTLGTPTTAPAAQPRNRPISPLERRRLAGGVPLAPVLREDADRAACRLDTPQLTARPQLGTRSAAVLQATASAETKEVRKPRLPSISPSAIRKYRPGTLPAESGSAPGRRQEEDSHGPPVRGTLYANDAGGRPRPLRAVHKPRPVKILPKALYGTPVYRSTAAQNRWLGAARTRCRENGSWRPDRLGASSLRPLRH